MKLLIVFLLIGFSVSGQTRLFFTASTPAPITNVAYDAAWGYTSEAGRYRLSDTKGSSAITVGAQIGPWTSGQNALDRQYISTRMNAGISFPANTVTVKAQLMVREYANVDNADRTPIVIKIVSEDGTVTRATLLTVTWAQAAEFINNATHRNKTVLSNSTLLSGGPGYTTVLGDRLVIELGYSDASGNTPEASAKWGENATDLPVNETQTTDGAGWLEFSNNITFAGELPKPRRLTLITRR